MAKRKDTEASAAIKVAAETPAQDTSAALTAPLPVEAPKIEMPAEAPKIELPSIEPPKLETLKVETLKIEPVLSARTTEPPPHKVADDIKPAIAAAAQADMPARSHRFALLAASVALAAAIGGIVGAGATAGFWHDASPPVDTAAAAETRALRDTVVRLSGDLATLKSHIDAANRNSIAHVQRLADRIDRTEKAQAEPAAKLAKIAESLDRLERRPATMAALPTPALAPAATDITGSVSTVDKSPPKPVVVEGWKLHDFYGGRAVVENRASGTLYEIGPGSNLPGIGRIETIKREDNRVIVVTPRGIITSSLEPPRRPAGYMPYR